MRCKPICPAAILALCCLLAPFTAVAVPREVTLYPTSARVVDVSRLVLQPTGQGSFKAVALLPSQVIPDSLTAKLAADSSLRIEDVSWRQIDRQEEPRLAELRRQLQAVRTERVSITSGIQALEAQIQFWQAQAKAKAKSMDEALAFSPLLTKNMKKALQEKLALEPDLERVDRRIRELQEEINRVSGIKEKQWEVTLTLSGPSLREVALTLDYTLSGCGWTPLYRLEALPRENRVAFTWEAELWQSSGVDWSQVEVVLATLPPRKTIQPPELPPWIVRPRPAAAPRARVMLDKAESVADAQALPEAQAGTAPEQRLSTFSLWQLGRRNLQAGTRQRFQIREESWPASFFHLIRPSQSPEAFIQAVIQLADGRDIPAGQATFLIDGATLGKRPFSLAGREATLAFGVDPLVTCESVLLSRLSGEKGFINDRQTQEWGWLHLVRNGRPAAVRVRIEDALPQVRDERIKVTAKGEPEPTEKTPLAAAWLLDVPGSDSRTVLQTIHLEAPREMDLDLGWRR